MRRNGLRALCLMLVCIPVVVTAYPPYGYVGVDMAGTAILEDDGAFGDGFDDESAGVRLYGGYRANDWFGVEIGFHDLGRYRQDDYRVSYSATVLSGVLYLPISNTFDLYGRLGGGIGRISENDSRSDSTRKVIGQAGVGAKFHVTPTFALRGGVDVYSMEPQLRGPDGGSTQTVSQEFGAGYVGVNLLF